MIKMNQQSVPPFIFQSYKLHFVPPFIFSKLQATHEPTEPHTTGWAGEVCHTVFYNQVQQNLTEPTPHEQSMRKLWERIWPTAVLDMRLVVYVWDCEQWLRYVHVCYDDK